MNSYPQEAWFVLACDLPYVSVDIIKFLIQKRNAGKMATAFRSHYTGHPEPLCALYEPRFKEIIKGFVADKIFCPRKIMLGSDVQLVELPDPHALDNINTREEYNRALAQLRDKDS
jgi:molybdopterin-guanine dinucleotide biosynthesis protein A